MRIYVNAILNHFRALQEWAAGKDAKLTHDLKSFEVEVKYRGRYYTFFPMFQARVDGRSVHSTALPKDVIGFGGWRPYLPLTHTHSTHKLRFKEHLERCGILTPRSLVQSAQTAGTPFDYLLKADVGSFGAKILGPFRAGSAPVEPAVPDNSSFVEEFIQGQILKVWYWGSQAFFAHSHEYPSITGDGSASVVDLLRERFLACRTDWQHDPNREVVLSCLRFQGVEPNSVLAKNESKWIDFRYGQHYEAAAGVTPLTDNGLAELIAVTGTQVADMGAAIAGLLKGTFAAPILLSVDGMLDAKGQIHWLEMNSNSIMPPEGYAIMLDDLFS